MSIKEWTFEGLEFLLLSSSLYRKKIKVIQTDLWTPNQRSEGFLRYEGQRAMSDVYEELQTQVKERFAHDEAVGFEYITPDYETKETKALFPKGAICVFVLPGANEGYRVNISVCHSEDRYSKIASCKVFSYEGAHKVSRFIYECFYGEDTMG